MTDDQLPVAQEPAQAWHKHINWWLLLIPPISAGVGVLVSRMAPEFFQTLQVQLEGPAPYMMFAVALLYGVRSVATWNRLCMVLTGLAAIFAMREFHWEWTHHGVYYMLATLGVWALLWVKHLAGPLRDWRHTSWLIATFAAYVLSQVIARRAFRVIPGEHHIHRSLEEWAEVTAHLMFLLAALVGYWPKARKADQAAASA